MSESTGDRYGSETMHYRGSWVLMDDDKRIRCNMIDDEGERYSWEFYKVDKNTIRWTDEGLDLRTY